jgi:hypothetical protein
MSRLQMMWIPNLGFTSIHKIDSTSKIRPVIQYQPAPFLKEKKGGRGKDFFVGGRWCSLLAPQVCMSSSWLTRKILFKFGVNWHLKALLFSSLFFWFSLCDYIPFAYWIFVLYEIKIVCYNVEVTMLWFLGAHRGALTRATRHFKNIDDGPIKVGSFEEIFFKTLGASPSLINRINMSRIE